MSAAELVQKLRTRAVPAPKQAQWNTGTRGTHPSVPPQKQAVSEGEIPGGTLGTHGTRVFAGVGEHGAESGLKRTYPDDVGASWRPLAAAYYRHHFGCQTCIAAGHGRGTRCPAGAALWKAHEAESDAAHDTSNPGSRAP